MPDADRRVVLAMPSFGLVTAGAARGYWRATRLPDSRVTRPYNEGSLLASNFNACWCVALNTVHRGGRVDYFAMQHADVEPEDWWLDTLIGEMEARDLDVLGVAVPIKDPHGRTSVALGRPDGDTWRPLCRLTTTEIHRLPATFTSEDVGHPLLLNTGLWVCRFDFEQAKKLHFTINDRVVFDKRSDSFTGQVEPEDWFFSRLCHELGLKVGCTRKVRVTHRGAAAYPNSVPWGDPYDTEATDRSLIPGCDRGGFSFPHDVDGWLTYDEGKALFGLARGRRVLEIGSYCGRSTVCLAQSAASVVSVDPHDGRATPRPKDTYRELLGNLSRYGVAGRVSALVGTVDDAPEGPYDLIFIDGDHSAESVRHDIGGAAARLAPGGVLAFHDYRLHPGEADGRWDPGVTEAVGELVSGGGVLLSRFDSLAVVSPPAATPLEV